jgi:acetyl-CoA carboxylase biotin carboxyl carrier protein
MYINNKLCAKDKTNKNRQIFIFQNNRVILCKQNYEHSVGLFKETNNKMQTETNNKIVDEVTEIIKFMGQNKLAELELETEAFSMKLRKHGDIVYHTSFEPVVPSKSVNFIDSAPVSKTVSSDNAQKSVTTSSDSVDANLKKVVAPMAGTFYSSPSPSAAPFVKEGDLISVGQTICIVEAMKMMNEIQTDKAGKIVSILGKNGQPIEKGAVLILVE